MNETPFSPIRRALLRGVLFATGFLLVVTLVTVILRSGLGSKDDLLTMLFSAFSAGAIAAILFAVEAFAAKRPPSKTRDAVAAIAAVLLAMTGVTFAIFQAVWIKSFAEAGEAKAAMTEVTEFARRFFERPGVVLAMMGAYGCPFGPLVVARLRLHSLAAQVAFVGITSLVLATPLVLSAQRSVDAPFVLGFVLMLAGLLPLAAAAADAIEERIARRYEADA